MAVSSARLRPKSDYSGKGPEAIVQQITDPSSRQRGRYKITNPQLSKGNLKEKEKLVAGPRRMPDTKTDWPIGRLTVGSKLTSTSTEADGGSRLFTPRPLYDQGISPQGAGWITELVWTLWNKGSPCLEWNPGGPARRH
jgi:hypothetical protein